MKVLISAGHTISGIGTGAVGYINEGQENRVLSKLIVEKLKNLGCEADYHEVNVGSNYIYQQTSKANSKNYDLVVQIHFNASDSSSANGSEVIYRSSKGKISAQKVQDKLKTMFRDRGVKSDINDLNRNLGWLRMTNPVAILIETCFVSSKSDCETYKNNKDKVAILIAEGITGKKYSDISSDDILKQKGTVTASVLNVRSGASTSYSIISKVYKDNVLDLLATSNGWYKIKLYNGDFGWISGEYLIIKNDITDVYTGFKDGDYSGKKATVTASSGLNVRYDRGTNYKIIDTLHYNQVVYLEYCLNGWVSIQGYKGNKGLGYVSTEYLKLI